jgi:hypothetical protein
VVFVDEKSDLCFRREASRLLICAIISFDCMKRSKVGYLSLLNGGGEIARTGRVTTEWALPEFAFWMGPGFVVL